MIASLLQRPAIDAVAGFGLVLLLAGCAATEIDTTYGKRRGAQGGASVNGTAVLADLYEAAGHRVWTWRRMSPKLQEFSTIVWFPNDFQPPTREQRAFVEEWLYSEPNRTFVYVGRDYEASITYWRTVQPQAPPAQAMEIARRLATAQSNHDAARTRIPKDESFDWFVSRGPSPPRAVPDLQGPWSEGIDAAKTEIEQATRLTVPDETQIDAWKGRAEFYWEGRPEFTPLLRSGDDVLVTQITHDEWAGSQLIIVQNGSFLLNLPLVNHEHRKLAGKLISASEPGRVAFLESGPGGPLIFDHEPDNELPTGIEVFTVWPLGFILMHLAVLGILVCISIFPIFGRARSVLAGTEIQEAAGNALAPAAVAGDPESTSATVIRADFGQHITALGELLERTQDRQYAQDRVTYYHEHVKRDSGVSHRKVK